MLIKAAAYDPWTKHPLDSKDAFENDGGDRDTKVTIPTQKI